MQSARELRLGNILIDKLTKNYLRVDTLSMSGMTTTVMDRSKYPLPEGWCAEPVPLTPEILEKCGFGLKEASGSFAWKFSAVGDVINVECKYLHQLQNLYFALTGEELQYTPSPTP